MNFRRLKWIAICAPIAFIGVLEYARWVLGEELQSLSGRLMMDAVVLVGALFFYGAGQVPMIKYHPSGAHSLHEAVAALAPDYHAILLRQHGVIVAGANMSMAIGVVEEVEQCCQIAVATGLKGASLTDEQLQAMDEALGRNWP